MLKNLPVILILAFSCLAYLSAQDKGFTKSDIFISGAFRIASATEGDIENYSFEFSPKVGYFVSDNIVVGGRLVYLKNETDNGAGNSSENTNYGAGVFGRYYSSPNKKFSLFGQVGIDYFRSEVSSVEFKTNTFSFGLGAGLNYFVSKRFSLEALLGFLDYSIASSTEENRDSRNVFRFGQTFQKLQ